LLTRAHELIPGTYLHFGFLDVGTESLPTPPEIPTFKEPPTLEGIHAVTSKLLRAHLHASHKALVASISEHHRSWDDDTLEAYIALAGVSTGKKIIKSRRLFRSAIQKLPSEQRARFITEAAAYAARKESLSIAKVQSRIGEHISKEDYEAVRTKQWSERLTNIYNPPKRRKVT
jgi:hypothetical protein